MENDLIPSSELDALDPSTLFSSAPVRVLGKTFPSDAARKEYYKNDLKGKLPSLKALDGFPRATDDAIIALSDPPYYTACPNPYISDFIKEWENEKGNKGDTAVTTPYASDVSVGKNNPIYNAHSYHTKVPHPAIMRYILHYTRPGDIVFDGFCGTGMTGVAAALCANCDDETKRDIEAEFRANGYTPPVWGARHAAMADLSPIASFISYNYNTPTNAAEFSRKAKAILDEVEKECGWMYATHDENGRAGVINYTVYSDVFLCNSCGGEIVFYDVAVDKERGEVKKEIKCPFCGAQFQKRQLKRKMESVFDSALGKVIERSVSVPVLISYTNAAGKRREKKPDKDDLDLIKKIDEGEIPYWYPSNALPRGDKTRDPINHYFTHVHHFYTKRNLWVAAAIRSICDKVDNKVFIMWLTSIMLTMSNMYTFRLNGKGGIIKGTLYIPSIKQEISLLYALYNKIDIFTKAFFCASRAYTNTQNNSNVISTASATNTLLADNTIDYIFTDPPFGANIMYSELNFINESWLGVKTNNTSEAIVNNTQDKGLAEYSALMQRSFKEYYRVLRPGHWMTVEFSNTAKSVWSAIQYALRKAGFVIANVAALDKKQGSFNSVTTPTAVKEDLVISCYKVSKGLQEKFLTSGVNNVWDFLDEHLSRLPIPAISEKKIESVKERSPRILYDTVIKYFVMKGWDVPLDAFDFQEQLTKRYVALDGMIFNQGDTAKYLDAKRAANLEGDSGRLFVDGISCEKDAIQWVKMRLEEKSQKYQDLQADYMKLYESTYSGDEELELADVLEENFIENTDKTWRIPNLDESKDIEVMHNKTLEKTFREYVSALESNKCKRLKSVRSEAVIAGFKKCNAKKDYKTIKLVGDAISEELLSSNELLYFYYESAKNKLQ